MTESLGPSNDDIPAAEMRLAEREARAQLKTIKANAKFALLTFAEQRVALAKDLLLWLATGKARAAGMNETPSAYLEIYDAGGARLMADTEVQKVNGHSCTVCGIGGLFACAVERDLVPLFWEGKHDYHIGQDGGGASHIWAVMGKVGLFNQEQMVAIELAYEGAIPRWCGAYTVLDQDLANRSRSFFLRHGAYDSNQRRFRLEAIMQNIIDNHGTFTP